MRLVDELLVAALDEREAVPEEGFGLRRARRARPTNAVAGCGGELAAGVAFEFRPLRPCAEALDLFDEILVVRAHRYAREIPAEARHAKEVAHEPVGAVSARPARVRDAHTAINGRRRAVAVEDYPHEIRRILRDVRLRLRKEVRPVARLLLRPEDHVPAVDYYELPPARKRREVACREKRKVEVRTQHLVLGAQRAVLGRGLRERRLKLPHAHQARRLDHVLRSHASTPDA